MIKINGAVENYVSEQDYFIVETFFKNQLKSKKYATIIHSNISYRLDNNMLIH